MKIDKPYYIDYVHSATPPAENFYHTLVRASDGAILYSSRDIRQIYAEAFLRGIRCDEVAVL